MDITFAQAIEHVSLKDWLEILGPIPLIIGCGYIFLNQKKTRENESRIHSWTVLWFLLSGTIHMFLEFLFVFSRNSLKALNVYAASDFRYGSPLESGTAAMETITYVFLYTNYYSSANNTGRALIDGPLCFLAAYGFIHRKMWFHPISLVLSTMQLYGLLWFILHPLFEPTQQVTTDPILFWAIFVGMNLPWGIFPVILWYKSFNTICANARFQQKAARKH